jgi:hypothetical protein
MIHIEKVEHHRNYHVEGSVLPHRVHTGSTITINIGANKAEQKLIAKLLDRLQAHAERLKDQHDTNLNEWAKNAD